MPEMCIPTSPISYTLQIYIYFIHGKCFGPAAGILPPPRILYHIFSSPSHRGGVGGGRTELAYNGDEGRK